MPLLFFTLSLVLLLPTGMRSVETKVTQQVYFRIKIGGVDQGRILIGLFGEHVPKTVKNFVTLATSGINGTKTYAGSKIHRVIRHFLIQGGDVVNGDGTGSVSIYGNYFPDENFSINHSAPGIISMANMGADKNGCQFFITTMEAPLLNGKFVVFGKVVEGQGIVHKIEISKTNYFEEPMQEILISESGELPIGTPYYVSDHPYTKIAFVKAISPPLIFSFIIIGIMRWMIKKLEINYNNYYE